MYTWKAAFAALALSFAAAFGVTATTAATAQAQEVTVRLFKVTTAKDEIVIGVTDAEMNAFGFGADLDNLAQRLVSAGEITVWH